MVWYFKEGDVSLIVIFCTNKTLSYNFSVKIFILLLYVCGTYIPILIYSLKWMVWFFEEGGVVLLRGLCGTLKRVVGYF